jgi:hypothetical protein
MAMRMPNLLPFFSNSETNEQIWYKQDGARFDSSQLTLKFGTNSLYKIHLKTRPPQKFETLHIGGSDLKLEQIENGTSGEYLAIWVGFLNVKMDGWIM